MQVWDPNKEKYTTVDLNKDIEPGGNGYYEQLLNVSGDYEGPRPATEQKSNSWIRHPISGGLNVLSSALNFGANLVGAGGGGDQTDQTQTQTGEGEEDNKLFAGMSSEQLVLLAGGAGLVYYLTQNS